MSKKYRIYKKKYLTRLTEKNHTYIIIHKNLSNFFSSFNKTYMYILKYHFLNFYNNN